MTRHRQSTHSHKSPKKPFCLGTFCFKPHLHPRPPGAIIGSGGLGSGKVSVGLDLSNKLIVLVIAAGIASVVIVALIKVGEIVVRRRTQALIAEHENSENGKDDETSTEG